MNLVGMLSLQVYMWIVFMPCLIRMETFSLVVPDGMKKEIVISHISYQMCRIPFGVYSKNNELNITLKEKISNLCDITIVSGKSRKVLLIGVCAHLVM